MNTAAIPLRLPGIAWMDQPDSDLTNNSDDATIFVGVTLADIRGTVYDDLDGNESISAGDGSIGGVLVELFQDANDDGIPDGPAIATTRTLGDGTYVFENQPNGTFLVIETDPTSHASVSDIFGLNDNKIKVVLDGFGVDSNGNDFLDVRLDYGDAPATYGTASAKISPSLRLGTGVTADPAARFDNADVDDGVNFQNAQVTTTGYTLPVTVTNTTGAPVWVCGWIDTNKNGTFENNERQCDEVLVGESAASLTWTGVGGLTGSSFSRFRVAPTLEQAQVNTGTPGLGEVEDYPINLATLPVTVAYFSSARTGNTIDVTWWSGTESANAGYVIYGGKNRNTMVALTDLIVGAGDSFQPLEYTASVDTHQKKLWFTGTRLWLADVDLVGVETLHGPYEVGTPVGTVPAPVAVDWEPAQTEVVATNQAAEPSAASAQNEATADAVASADEPPRVKVSRVVGAGNVAALSVETDGIYRVSFDDLVAAGLDWTGVTMNTLAVIDASGDPVAIRTSGGGKFTTGKLVEFWADSIDTLYTGTNVYRLVVDPSQRLLMPNDRTAVPKPTVGAATSSMHTTVVEEQKLYSPSMPGDDPWFAQRLFSFGAPSTTVVERRPGGPWAGVGRRHRDRRRRLRHRRRPPRHGVREWRRRRRSAIRRHHREGHHRHGAERCADRRHQQRDGHSDRRRRCTVRPGESRPGFGDLPAPHRRRRRLGGVHGIGRAHRFRDRVHEPDGHRPPIPGGRRRPRVAHADRQSDGSVHGLVRRNGTTARYAVTQIDRLDRRGRRRQEDHRVVDRGARRPVDHLPHRLQRPSR